MTWLGRIFIIMVIIMLIAIVVAPDAVRECRVAGGSDCGSGAPQTSSADDRRTLSTKEPNHDQD